MSTGLDKAVGEDALIKGGGVVLGVACFGFVEGFRFFVLDNCLVIGGLLRGTYVNFGFVRFCFLFSITGWTLKRSLSYGLYIYVDVNVISLDIIVQQQ